MPFDPATILAVVLPSTTTTDNISSNEFELKTGWGQISRGVMMAEIQETLQELINKGNELVRQGGDLMTGYKEEFQPEYLAWRIQSLAALRQLGTSMKQPLQELESDPDGRYFYSSSVRNILGGLKGALALAENGMLTEREFSGYRKPGASRAVFVVHGRDTGTKELVSRFLKSLDVVPVILHEQSNKGRTIIEKFEQHANVEFAVVLLTPDDVGGLQADEATLEPRARQNVIFEMGYFIGRLGRDRVCAITKDGVEIPSDYSGVLYIPLDEEGAWMTALAQEMRSSVGVGDDE